EPTGLAGGRLRESLAGEGGVVVDATHAIDRLIVGPTLAGSVHDALGHRACAVALRLVVRPDHHRRAVDLQAPFVGRAGLVKAHLEPAALDGDRLDLRARQRADLRAAGEKHACRESEEFVFHDRTSSWIIAAPFSPIMMVGALVLPVVSVGITEASIT